MTERFLKIYLEPICVADLLIKQEITRQTNYGNMSIETLKFDKFCIGVDKSITRGEDLM